MLIDSSINNFYDQSSEDTRLQTGLGPLEFHRNKQLISRYLPTQPETIADIGGGTGHYAQWLSALGHQVVLIDPVSKHIKLAKKRAARSGKPFLCKRAESRHLPIETNWADLVILHGPLYHLEERDERIKALREARRVLKTGGTVLGFAISYTASTLAALHSGMIHHPEIYQMCRNELFSGEHEPPTSFPGMLAPAFFHRPDELLSEFREAGFQKQGLYAIEGLAWMDARFFESWASDQKRETLLQLIEATESDPGLLSISPHMMIAVTMEYEF